MTTRVPKLHGGLLTTACQERRQIKLSAYVTSVSCVTRKRHFVGV